MWSARTCPRFESGDMSRHSKNPQGSLSKSMSGMLLFKLGCGRCVGKLQRRQHPRRLEARVFRLGKLHKEGNRVRLEPAQEALNRAVAHGGAAACRNIRPLP